VTFDDFLPHVLPSVEGCPDEVARDHVVKAAREFCGRTLVWNYATTPIAAEAGKANYTLQLAADRELVRVLMVDVDGVEYVVPNAVTGRAAQRRACGRVCIVQGPQDFTLVPAPDIEGTPIVTEIAVKPKLTSNYWPDDLAEHVSDIAHGAIATLCMLPRKEWTETSIAAAEQTMFSARISTVGAKISRGRGASRMPSRAGFL